MSTLIKTLNHNDIYDYINPQKNPDLKAAVAGKSVIITGAGAGIGRGIVEQFAHAGATTFFLSVRSKADELQATADLVKSINSSARVFTSLLDHTKLDQVEHLFEIVKKELGTSADILVNNAGIAGHLSDIAHSDPNKWWGSIEVLLKGPYLMSRVYIRSTLDAGNKGGIIIHTSSVGSYYTFKDLAAYQIAKISLNRLSEFICHEHAKDGIRSISFHPGAVNTSWWDTIGPENPLSAMRPHVCTDTPNLPGGTVVYLTTPEAAYLNGRYVSCNWDMKELLEKKDEIVSNGLLLITERGDKLPHPY
ncbi:hypothetical protein BDZ91DRAFT_652575 [Kalaharituber pfeilii]|nr:hypothetical protein BDZ91DRAFT_652575 [Kalaharituber pfeilii]